MWRLRARMFYVKKRNFRPNKKHVRLFEKLIKIFKRRIQYPFFKISHHKARLHYDYNFVGVGYNSLYSEEKQKNRPTPRDSYVGRSQERSHLIHSVDNNVYKSHTTHQYVEKKWVLDDKIKSEQKYDEDRYNRGPRGHLKRSSNSGILTRKFIDLSEKPSPINPSFNSRASSYTNTRLKTRNFDGALISNGTLLYIEKI